MCSRFASSEDERQFRQQGTWSSRLAHEDGLFSIAIDGAGTAVQLRGAQIDDEEERGPMRRGHLSHQAVYPPSTKTVEPVT